MDYYFQKLRSDVARIVEAQYGMSLDGGELVIERPPHSRMGDLACPLFSLSKRLGLAPRDIGVLLIPVLEEHPEYAKVQSAGPYLNVWLSREPVVSGLLAVVQEQGAVYGHNDALKERRVLVEFSSPNTNKPLHLGHLRNNSIGESVSRILQASSAEVQKRNLINDRGVHICKAMLAYQVFGEGNTPESESKKSDHFIGDYYVAFSSWDDPEKEDKAQEMLQQWEQGAIDVIQLWKQLRNWALAGMQETYERTGIHFDLFDFESETYQVGREAVLQGLSQGVFFQKADGSVWADLRDVGLDEKVLLRADQTALYATQDIGTAIQRFSQWPFDRMLYVVASEQVYHFRVLFHLLGRLGYHWADRLSHLSYGMVTLPEGKMKSREGTVVDADTLIDKMAALAAEEISEKNRVQGNVMEVAEKIAIAALNYYLLKPHPSKDISFDPHASVAFTGDTGPYLQYTLSRIASMERKKAATEATAVAIDLRHLVSDDEWELVKLLLDFPRIVRLAGEQLNPSLIANYLFSLAKSFSNYYHRYPIIVSDDRVQAESRFALARSIRQVLENGMQLLAIPLVYTM